MSSKSKAAQERTAQEDLLNFTFLSRGIKFEDQQDVKTSHLSPKFNSVNISTASLAAPIKTEPKDFKIFKQEPDGDDELQAENAAFFIKKELDIEEHKPGWELSGSGNVNAAKLSSENTSEGKKVYNCTHCLYETDRRCNLIMHFNCKHNKQWEMYKSPSKCAQTNESQSSESKIYNCTDCLYKTNRRCNLTMHHNRKHKKSDQMYYKRPKRVEKNELLQSSKREREGKMYNCAHCPHKTNRRYNFIMHYNCKHRPAYQMYKDELKRTKQEKVYKCEECSYQTKVKQSLTQHSKRKHDEDAEIYKCEECPFETKYKTALTRHCGRKHSKIKL